MRKSWFNSSIVGGLRMGIRNFMWKFQWAPVYFGDSEFCDLYTRILIREGRTLLTVSEFFNLCSAVRSARKIKGDMAEVGVYKGGSAKIISIVDGQNKKLHVFDTFEGLPEVDTVDTKFKKGDYSNSLENVQKYLSKHRNIFFYKGFFPETARPLQKTRFSFVHLDVDIYGSTKDSLEFFYPRMNKGGIILSHDYPFAEGVKKAFDEFFEDKKETILTLMNNQAMVIKL